ncbi:MAG: TetR/AcrR family transcriptional regulator [Pseudomonadota bacterium]
MGSTQKAKRRELILDAALELFNEMGSGKATTNHIAKAMGISPGNLYYHYKSKEHIIRELLKRLIEGFDALVPPPVDDKSFPLFVGETMDAICHLFYKYRFIYLELAALLARDGLFREMYHDIKVRRVRDFRLLFDALADLGVFTRTIAPNEQETLVFIIWTYAEGIITALHGSNILVTPETIQTHFKKIILILKAYLDPALWPALARQLDLS